jgi:hypothetical protein
MNLVANWLPTTNTHFLTHPQDVSHLHGLAPILYPHILSNTLYPGQIWVITLEVREA